MTFLILVIGDLHIPDRALDIPAKVMRKQEPASLLLLPWRSVVTESTKLLTLTLFRSSL
jgi:predicted phosphodiesterase